MDDKEEDEGNLNDNVVLLMPYVSRSMLVVDALFALCHNNWKSVQS
jgi:hypothetical protein